MPSRTSTRRGAKGRKRVATKKKSTSRGRVRTSLLETLRTRLRTTLGRQADDVWGVVLVVFAIVVILGFLEQAGPAGRVLEPGSRFRFGIWRFLIPPLLTGLGGALIVGKPLEGSGRLLRGALVTSIGTAGLFL